jgi:hypothetical protein
MISITYLGKQAMNLGDLCGALKQAMNLNDICGARCRDLPKVV